MAIDIQAIRSLLADLDIPEHCRRNVLDAISAGEGRRTASQAVPASSVDKAGDLFEQVDAFTAIGRETVDEMELAQTKAVARGTFALAYNRLRDPAKAEFNLALYNDALADTEALRERLRHLREWGQTLKAELQAAAPAGRRA